jgi:tRNA threonylcarbamoyladenosine biosynthesis protein TsaB
VRLLALDTATEACSVALAVDAAILTRELELERGHAEQILPLIDAVLAEGQVSLRSLDAIAFGRGPGAFTGVRLAASVTQGLAFAAGLPVIPVSDLAAVAQRALASGAAAARILVCNDARMREVYWACFERGPGGLATPAGPERVGKPGEVAPPGEWLDDFCGAGRGWTAYPELGSRLEGRLKGLFPDLLPRAREVAALAVPLWQQGEAVPAEAALPVYLRDQVARPSPD